MDEHTSLSSILDDEAPPAAPAAPEAPPAAEPKGEQEPKQPDQSRRKAWREKELNLQADGAGMTRDPNTGQFVKKEAAPEQPKAPEAPAAPAAAPAAPQPPAQPEMTERERAFQRALMDERRKRQEIEQRFQQTQQPQTPAEQPKAFWDDPEGALKAHDTKMQERETQLTLNTTERLARIRYPDFDEKVAEFAQIVQSTPGLAQQWLAANDPAEFAYVTGKNHLLLKQVGSLDALTDQVRKETEARVRAQVEAEFKAKQEAFLKEREALPPSLNDTRGATTGAHRPVFNGPTPLEDILK